MPWRRAINTRAAFLLVAAIACTEPVVAQSAAEYRAWVAWCQQRGTVTGTTSNPICVPREEASPPTFNAPQQTMVDLAGQFGSLLGNAIRQSLQEAERRAAIEQMQRDWELQRARLFAGAEQARLAERERLRNESLLTSMQGAIRNSELGLVGVERQPLRLRTRDQMFGVPSNPAGETTQDVVVAGPVASPAAPGPVSGRPVEPSQDAAARTAWDNYLAALQRRNESDARLASTIATRDSAERIVEAATRRVETERAAASSSSAPQPAPKVDDRLAEAQRLLVEATALRDQAVHDVGEARQAADVARRTLDEAGALAGRPAPPQ